MALELGDAAKATGQLQMFFSPPLVMADDAVGQDHLTGGAAKVFGHEIDFGPVARLKVEDKIGIRAPPLIDGLVVVADGHVVAVRRGNQVQQFGLGQVDILKLIDQHTLIAPLDLT